jgi:hypothetical protein
VHIVAEHVEFKPKFKSDGAEPAEEQEESNDSREAVDFPEEEVSEATS